MYNLYCRPISLTMTSLPNTSNIQNKPVLYKISVKQNNLGFCGIASSVGQVSLLKLMLVFFVVYPLGAGSTNIFRLWKKNLSFLFILKLGPSVESRAPNCEKLSAEFVCAPLKFYKLIIT